MIKVLTIKEPFGSLIKDGYKKYETRSWKTNYRGEIYINAGLAKINLKDQRICKLSKMVNVNKGYIICKVTLTDCILITKEFRDILSDIEKECGDFSDGRYAWKLENITEVEPIAIKGQLGLWNYEK
jgi:hypothetical protein